MERHSEIVSFNVGEQRIQGRVQDVIWSSSLWPIVHTPHELAQREHSDGMTQSTDLKSLIRDEGFFPLCDNTTRSRIPLLTWRESSEGRRQPPDLNDSFRRTIDVLVYTSTRRVTQNDAQNEIAKIAI